MGSKQIAGQVIDAAGNPVPGAVVSSYWGMENDTPITHPEATTDAAGYFLISREWTNDYAKMQVVMGLLALNQERNRGGSVVVNSASPEIPL